MRQKRSSRKSTRRRPSRKKRSRVSRRRHVTRYAGAHDDPRYRAAFVRLLDDHGVTRVTHSAGIRMDEVLEQRRKPGELMEYRKRIIDAHGLGALTAGTRSRDDEMILDLALDLSLKLIEAGIHEAYVDMPSLEWLERAVNNAGSGLASLAWQTHVIIQHYGESFQTYQVKLEKYWNASGSYDNLVYIHLDEWPSGKFADEIGNGFVGSDAHKALQVLCSYGNLEKASNTRSKSYPIPIRTLLGTSQYIGKGSYIDLSFGMTLVDFVNMLKTLLLLHKMARDEYEADPHSAQTSVAARDRQRREARERLQEENRKLTEAQRRQRLERGASIAAEAQAGKLSSAKENLRESFNAIKPELLNEIERSVKKGKKREQFYTTKFVRLAGGPSNARTHETLLQLYAFYNRTPIRDISESIGRELIDELAKDGIDSFRIHYPHWY